jgi:hypothetical protein
MEFNQAWLSVLGALCSAVGTALARLPRMNLPEGLAPDARCLGPSPPPRPSTLPRGTAARLQARPYPDPLVYRTPAPRRPPGRSSAPPPRPLHLLGPAVTCGAPRVLSEQLRSRISALTDIGIDLHFRRAHRGSRIIELCAHSGDAPRPKTLPRASPIPPPTPQPAHSELLPRS